ncbi:uncharacterized protein BDV14DRAFT_196154 [Aspergillus stella-maris]|uniref:uncharacterized protein n=1 Tax=Aspergillus stella-maris TaxID=1810926 RepID=UPI003CCD6B7E
MPRLFAGPQSLSKNMAFDRKYPLASSSYFDVPMDTFGHGLPALNFDPRTMHIPSPETTAGSEQFQMRNNMTVDRLSSMTPNMIPNGDFLVRESQTNAVQYNSWPMSFPLGEPTESDISNTFDSRSTSQNSQCWIPLEIENLSPASQPAVDEISFSNADAPSPHLFHPVPRHTPQSVTSYFTSEKVPEASSALGQMDNSLPDRTSETNVCTAQEPEWTNDNLLYPGLLPSQPTGTASITSTTDTYTVMAPSNTYNTSTVHSWPPISSQISFEVQQPTANQSEDDLSWNNAPIWTGVSQQQNQISQFPVTATDIDGLLYMGSSTETYVQPPSLLDLSGLTSSTLYLNGDNSTSPEYNQTQYLNDEVGSQDEFQRDDSTDSCFNIPRNMPSRSGHTSCVSSWTVDAKNALLLDYKRRGLSYKDIKRIGGFKEAESTLRGRYRTLTKSKEQRVRRPQWHENDMAKIFNAKDAIPMSMVQIVCALLSGEVFPS